MGIQVGGKIFSNNNTLTMPNETGTLATQEYVAANAGGGSGGGLELESYQNSAMSAPVMAYVFRDEDDSIFKVYEPIRNNEVSRKTFAYADSIDKFPFDKTDWFNNRFLDIKLIDVPVNSVVNGCIFETMIVDANSGTGLTLINVRWRGKYGEGTANGAELYVTGNTVTIQNSEFIGGAESGSATYFDSLGDNSYVSGCTFLGSNDCDFLGNSANITRSTFDIFAGFEANTSGGIIHQTYIGNSGYVDLYAGRNVTSCQLNAGASLVADGNITNCEVGRGGSINAAGFAINQVIVEAGLSFTATGNLADKHIANIDGAAYLLGVTDGAVTATAV